MNDLIELKRDFEASLEDFIMNRSERKALHEELRNAQLDERERQVLWSDMRKMALASSADLRTQQLVDWLYECGKLLRNENDDKRDTHEVYFSPGTACREAICSRIRFAKKLIRICVFTISDDEITEELLLAHRLGKNVRMITDNDKMYDVGSDIQQLMDAGIEVVIDRTDAHMHHKFAVFDNDYLLTGSYNWTRSAATHNFENLIVLQNHDAFISYEREFERLWAKLK